VSSFLTALALIAAGYLIGSLPWGYWLPRWFAGVDIRTVGSGNTGATNVWRTLGFKLGLAVALLDIAKGATAALLARWLADDLVALLAGAGAVVGHYRPIFLRFARGGKAVAVVGGVGIALAPFATLAAAGVWIVVFLITRYASVASMVGAMSLPLFALLFGASVTVLVFTVAATVAVVLLHRANIQRLRAGTEKRITLRRRRGAVAA
jgi:glycerol-3-phosphate acyltransferase PlsY